MTTVALAYLHPGWVHHAFMDSVLRCLSYRSDDFRVIRVAKQSSADIAGGRHELSRWAVNDHPPPEYLWWVDADMVFTPSTLERLLEVDEDVVSAVCRGQHEEGATFLTAMELGDDGLLHRLQEEDIAENAERGAVMTVDAFGLGCCLIRTEVLRKLDWDNTWPFTEAVGLLPGHPTIPTEADVSFCLRLGAAGVPLWLDPSTVVGHIKEHIV